MELGWMWFTLGLAWLVNIGLFIWSLRLRMEVWANRRVIASLEMAARHTEQKGRSNRTNGIHLLVVLVVVVQLLFLLQQVGK